MRYNNAAGLLAQPLSADSGPDTITFAANPGFGTIAAPDYIPLVLDPPVGASPNPNFEVVHLTAYTLGQLTGTIQRAQESSSAHGHNVNAVWAAAPVAGDFGFAGEIDISGAPNPTFVVYNQSGQSQLLQVAGSMPQKWVFHGPYQVDSQYIAQNNLAENVIPYAHNLGTTNLLPVDLGKQDGSFSHGVGIRWTLPDANTITFHFLNLLGTQANPRCLFNFMLMTTS